jgi:hypothetical protein
MDMVTVALVIVPMLLLGVVVGFGVADLIEDGKYDDPTAIGPPSRAVAKDGEALTSETSHTVNERNRRGGDCRECE